MKIPKHGSWWTFRGDQSGCGKNQQVCMADSNETIAWGQGFSWLGSTDMFLKLFTPVEPQTHKELQ